MTTIATRNARIKQVIYKTPVALAASLLVSAVLAQPADNTTSADASATSGSAAVTGQPGIGPRPFTSFLQRLSSPVEQIRVVVAADNLPADGVGTTEVVVSLLGKTGQPVPEALDVTVEVDGGARILLPGRRTSE